MIAADYDHKLADTIYQDAFFSIPCGQFPADADITHEVDSRIHEQDEATEQAKELADRFGKDVAVDVYGTWGFYGKEFIENFNVMPTAKTTALATEEPHAS